MPKSLLGSPSETMENNGNIALGVGVILLLLNVGVGVSGVLDGVIEGNVETAVTVSYTHLTLPTIGYV